jgi:aminopeptidase N
VIIPVELRERQTEVREARGMDAPQFVFANAEDYGYMLTRLDGQSLRALERGGVNHPDPFLRAMLWGALWDEVRAARLSPSRFGQLALGLVVSERDEQIVPRLLGRLRRVAAAYLSEAERAVAVPEMERTFWDGAADTTRPYGIRKAFLDAYIDVASTPEAIARIESLLGADSAVGEPLRDPTRWEIVNRLLVRSVPGAEQRLEAQRTRDATADGRRRAFIAGAAIGTAETKRAYFTRYFGDSTLNEDWASGSLGAFNALDHQALTLTYLRPALDSLRYIQDNRRIFFLGAWLGSFLGGQTSEAALTTVQRFLRDNPELPADLRRKVLENVDELERTVRIRRRF